MTNPGEVTDAALQAAGMTRDAFAELAPEVRAAIIEAAVAASPERSNRTLILTDGGMVDDETGEMVEDPKGPELQDVLPALVSASVQHQRAQMDVGEVETHLARAHALGRFKVLRADLGILQGLLDEVGEAGPRDAEGASVIARVTVLVDAVERWAQAQLKAKVAGEAEAELLDALGEAYQSRTQGLVLKGMDPESRASFRLTMPKPAVYFTQAVKPETIMRQDPALASALGIVRRRKAASRPRIKLVEDAS